MNTFVKVFIAIIGGVNVAFDMFIPIAISLLLVNVGGFNNFSTYMILIIGFISSVYRGINVGFLRD